MSNNGITTTIKVDAGGCIIATARHREGMTCAYDGDDYVISNDENGDVETTDALRYAARIAQEAAFESEIEMTQGNYGRTARRLIDIGICTPKKASKK